MKQINGLRFIVGNGCNYNCFYCHHEGFFDKDNVMIDNEKLKKIYYFSKNNNINNISITGGEPFLYWKNTYEILKMFNNDNFNKTLNSNLSLLHNYINEIKLLNPIEFHVNLSSLNTNTHQKIINSRYLSQVLINLELLKNTQHRICLNIPVLKGINFEELNQLYNYAIKNDFIPRFLILMPINEELESYVVGINEILKVFGGGEIIYKYSYGLYKINTKYGIIDVVKCLCDDLECKICKKNTYLHITPNFDIKYCMQCDDTVKINFESDDTINHSFEVANKRLEKIKK